LPCLSPLSLPPALPILLLTSLTRLLHRTTKQDERPFVPYGQVPSVTSWNGTNGVHMLSSHRLLLPLCSILQIRYQHYCLRLRSRSEEHTSELQSRFDLV